MKKITAVLLVAITLAALTSMKLRPSNELIGVTSLSTTLSGAAEIPGPGDPDGMGTFHARLNQGQGTISYELTVSGIDPATSAHIHIGSSTVAGPVLITLEAPTDGSSSGTITGIDPEVIKDLRKNPGNYYVNVHNAAYPPGAVRGQLHK